MVVSANDDDETHVSKSRQILLVVILIVAVLILIIRLFYLTIIQGARFQHLSQENRTREVVIPAPRGVIYDRDGTALTRNIPAFKYPDGEIVFEHKTATKSGQPVEEVAREYVFGDLFSHVLGYTGSVTEDEVGKSKVDESKDTTVFRPGDTVGRMGIEAYYDKQLRGTDGKELYEVDATGQNVRILGRIDPIPGDPIKLTLDRRLQDVARSELAGKKGAVIVTIPSTGEVLSLYSSPSFDPNTFVRAENVETLLANSDQPMFDRAIGGLYPPGSTFKIISSIAGLESGAIKPDTQFEDVGILRIGEFSFGNWNFLQYGKTEGWMDIVKAITRSNDIFFYKVGEALGVTKLAEWGRKFGMEKPTGIDLPGENSGIMPDPVWRKKTLGTEWYLGDTYHISIGQGDILATPIQVNAWTELIANGGKLCKPHVAQSQNKTNCKDFGIKPQTINLITKGMEGACNEGGTAYPLFNFRVPLADSRMKLTIDGEDFLDGGTASGSGQLVNIPIACKTGTAEFGDPKNMTHAWLTAFAPVHKPQIAVTVLVESGGEGSTVAAPIAKKIFETWFGK